MITLTCECCNLPFQAEAQCKHRTSRFGWCRTCIHLMRKMRPYGRDLAQCEIELLHLHQHEQWPDKYSLANFGRLVVKLLDNDTSRQRAALEITAAAVEFGLGQLNAHGFFVATPPTAAAINETEEEPNPCVIEKW